MRPGRVLFVWTATVAALSAVPAQAETIRVTIDRVAFAPVEIQGKVGDTIEWVNRDILAHTATVRGDFDVMIAAGKSGRLVLKKPGDIEYFCRFHPNMKGRIVVSSP
jgi:plastocyanin